MMPLSLLIAGPVSDALGIRFWFIMGGAIVVLIAIAATFIPAIMNIETNNSDDKSPAESGIADSVPSGD
jgi:DHA3 family macrolide efflux protein-like MFS transporter